MLVYGESEMLKNYPLTMKFPVILANDKKTLRYDLSYVGLQHETRDNYHASFMNNRDIFWYFYNELAEENQLLKLLRLPEGVEFAISMVIYICFEVLSSMNVNIKRKRKTQIKTQKKEKKVEFCIDVENALVQRERVQLMRRSVLKNYVEFNRKVQRVPGKGRDYLKELKVNIQENGLKVPIHLSVSRKTGRAYVHDGNHRMSVLEDLKVEWVPVKISYVFIHKDDDKKFNFIPAALSSYPDYPTPSDMGFETKDLQPRHYTDTDDEE